MSRKNVEFKLDLKGLSSLMKSGAMAGQVDALAQSVANATGGQVLESAHPISFINIATVRTPDDEDAVKRDCEAVGIKLHKQGERSKPKR